MYVVTYYSFKGGVGRTMALINTAASLALRGCRVLLIDFDLEAPGIPTYGNLGCAAKQPGIVDYVHRYVESGRAPDVQDYMVACSVKGLADGLVHVMPAGAREPSYGERLAAVDWQALYRDHQGYLMFEDMKQQLAALEPKIDYVLIDSRTGHTDVGGICTRQLPDAVVMMFYPNDQNLQGLRSVVADVRAENDARQRKIDLLFCPSNVPDLDDEDDILKDHLQGAAKDLRFRRPASVIRHYDSLTFLDQPIFVLDRSRTRLAEEYRTLATAVARGNAEDRVGALAQIEEIEVDLRVREAMPHDEAGNDRGTSLKHLSEQLGEIGQHHARDGEVAWALASAYQAMGNRNAECDALGVAIEQGFRLSEGRVRRAFVLLGIGRRPEALEDLRAVLSLEDTDAIDFCSAAQQLGSTREPWVELIRTSPALARFGPEDLLQVAHILTTDADGAELAAEIAGGVLRSAKSPVMRGQAQTLLELGLIGAGRFDEAMTAIDVDRAQVLQSLRITSVFNYAMAEWGATRQPPPDLLRCVVALDEEVKDRDGTNYFQCLSLVHAVLGHPDEARRMLDRAIDELAPGLNFSCWSYLHVEMRAMRKDLDALGAYIARGGGDPEFIRRRMSA